MGQTELDYQSKMYLDASANHLLEANINQPIDVIDRVIPLRRLCTLGQAGKREVVQPREQQCR